jgi:MGT family glycosyltransferase
MTTGDDRDPVALDLGPIASNVRVARWVSHSDLLPYTDVVVTTGGAGTVLAALHAGVPLVIVPTEWDKPENAQRVVEAGAGLRLSPRRCTPERLRAVVERVLEEPAFCRNARRLGTVFARYGGAERAAELLEGLCVGRPVDRDVIV